MRPAQSTLDVPVSDQNQKNRPELIKPSHNREVQHWKQGWFSMFCLQKTTIRRSTNLSGSDPVIQEELSFLAGSPLLGLYVKLSIQRGSISPLSISIHFPQVLDLSWESKWSVSRLEAIVAGNNLGEFQTLLSERVITLDTLVSWGGKDADSATSLLGVSSLMISHWSALILATVGYD